MTNKVYVSQTYPGLIVYDEENVRGSSRVFRGNLDIRNTDNNLGRHRMLALAQSVISAAATIRY